MTMAGIDQDTQEKAWEFTKAMAKEMSFGNSDGLGYAAMGGDGELFGERWLNNKEAFSERNSLSPLEAEIISKHKGALSKPVTYNRFGVVSDNNMRSITLHTRMATSGKEFYNTHPFVLEDTSLIHNGVVDDKKLTLLQSTCDSEGILNEYIKLDVANDISKIQDLSDRLDGYYACMVLSKKKDGTPILDVFKDHRAELHAAWVKELNTLVISTSIRCIEDACKTLNFTIVSQFDVSPGYIWRYDALTGELLEVVQFDPFKAKREAKKSEKATTTTPTAGHGSTRATGGSVVVRGDTAYWKGLMENEDFEYDNKTGEWVKTYSNMS